MNDVCIDYWKECENTAASVERYYVIFRGWNREMLSICRYFGVVRAERSRYAYNVDITGVDGQP